MNKALIVILILVVIGAGAFYFLFLTPSSEVSTKQEVKIAKVDTTFNLGVLDKLDSFFSHGNFPIVVPPSSLRGSNPAKANDPFFN